jgi:hypothetical protein
VRRGEGKCGQQRGSGDQWAAWGRKEQLRKWGDNKEGCDDNKGRNEGRNEGIKREKMSRGARTREGGRRGRDGWNAGTNDNRKGGE